MGLRLAEAVGPVVEGEALAGLVVPLVAEPGDPAVLLHPASVRMQPTTAAPVVTFVRRDIASLPSGNEHLLVDLDGYDGAWKATTPCGYGVSWSSSGLVKIVVHV